MSLGKLHVVKQSNKISSASVIFLHGSGQSGKILLDWIRSLIGNFSLPHVNFYFPTAPLRPYTPLQGELSNVWFDRYDVTPDVPEDSKTIESTGKETTLFINKIVESGTPLNRIIIGGFSMGGALALHVAYRFSPGLAGVFTLSSFLNNNSAVFRNPKSLEVPLYMCHGDRDRLVPIAWGQKTHKGLTQLGINAEFITIKYIMHDLKKEEIEDLFHWIQKILPPLESDNK